MPMFDPFTICDFLYISDTESIADISYQIIVEQMIYFTQGWYQISNGFNYLTTIKMMRNNFMNVSWPILTTNIDDIQASIQWSWDTTVELYEILYWMPWDQINWDFVNI